MYKRAYDRLPGIFMWLWILNWKVWEIDSLPKAVVTSMAIAVICWILMELVQITAENLDETKKQAKRQKKESDKDFVCDEDFVCSWPNLNFLTIQERDEYVEETMKKIEELDDAG